MVGHARTVPIGPSTDEGACRPAKDAIKWQERSLGREGVKHRRGQRRFSEATAYLSVPVIEIPNNKHIAVDLLNNVDQLIDLGQILSKPIAKMSRNNGAFLSRHAQMGLNDPTRLTRRQAEIMQIDRVEGPAADQDMAIMAIWCHDRARLGRMRAKGISQSFDGYNAFSTARVYLLQCDDIGIVLLNEANDALEIIATIRADSGMNIPAQDAKWFRRRQYISHAGAGGQI
jgi:hypothetical protein